MVYNVNTTYYNGIREAWGAPSLVWGSDDGGRICESSFSQTSLWSNEGLVDWVSCG